VRRPHLWLASALGNSRADVTTPQTRRRLGSPGVLLAGSGYLFKIDALSAQEQTAFWMVTLLLRFCRRRQFCLS